jgi:predicted RND superfamily exporter protein
LAAIRDEIVVGLPLKQAIRAALSGAGTTILSTYLVMIAGLVPWVFSPVLFQNEMSELLILVMTTNLIAGLLILPALLILIRPRFLESINFIIVGRRLPVADRSETYYYLPAARPRSV